MPHPTHSHPVVTRTYARVFWIIPVLGLLIAFLAPGSSSAQTEPAADEKKKGTMVRIFCVESLSKAEEDEVILATKTEDEKWTEHGKVTLRSPFITSWVRVPRGTTFLVKKEGDKYKSFGSFLLPEQSDRSIVILFPDKSKNTYRTQVLDPGNLGFQKGKALIVNYGKVPAMVIMGKTKLTVNPGQQVVEKIDAGPDGMFPMLVGYLDKDQKIVACYDKQVSANPKTRRFILLFPDQVTGLRAMSLSEFGPFE
jgi:hypothetical protein